MLRADMFFFVNVSSALAKQELLFGYAVSLRLI